MSVIGTLLTAWLATVFLYAATQKFLGGYRASIAAVQGYRILPKWASAIGGYALPWTELLVAIALLVRPTHRVGAIGAAVLGLIFATGSAAAIARGINVECGCTGAKSSRVNWMTTTRAVVIVAAGGLVVVNGRGAVGTTLALLLALVATSPPVIGAWRRRAAMSVHRARTTTTQVEVARLTKLLQTSVSGGPTTDVLPTIVKEM